MEKKDKHKEEAFLQHPVLFIAVLVIGFVLMGPFEIGPVGEIEFTPVKHDIAPYKEVMGSWPRDNESRLGNGKLEFVDEVFGPESLEFDGFGRGPYTGLADGRVVDGWARVSDGRHSPLLHQTDAYYGLLVVGPTGGLATPLATHVGGKQILFANDPDIHKNGSIFSRTQAESTTECKSTTILKASHYFSQYIYTMKGYLQKIIEQVSFLHTVGRRNDRKDSQILSSDKDNSCSVGWLSFSEWNSVIFGPEFPLITETSNCRLMKYWFEGPKAGTMEIVADLPGFPDNVRINDKGQFWVAIDCCRTQAQEILVHNPWMRSLYFRLPIKMKILARIMGMKMFTLISLFDENGEIVEVLEDRKGMVMKLVSEVREVEGKLWIGTVAHNHIATLSYP